MRVFLRNLEEGQTAAWQIRQAADAVNLYCGQYRPPAKAPDPTEPSGTAAPDDAGAVLLPMEDLLRLRHYSPRTQRSYGEWTRRYFRYL